MTGDVIGLATELLPGAPLLVPAMRAGLPVNEETISTMRARTTR